MQLTSRGRTQLALQTHNTHPAVHRVPRVCFKRLALPLLLSLGSGTRHPSLTTICSAMAPVVTEAQVAQAVRVIVASADINLLTERQVRRQLANQEGMGEDVVTKFGACITSTIEQVLEELAPPEEEEEEEPVPEAEAPKKRKQPKKETKGQKLTPVQSGGEDLVLALAGSKIKVTVGTYQNKLRCDLREFYVKDGQELPGSKGISLSVSEWMILATHLSQLQQALAAQDVSQPQVQLSELRRAYVSSFGGRVSVHIREFYKKDEQLLPGTKGVSLQPDVFSALVEHAAAIHARLSQLGGPMAPLSASGPPPATSHEATTPAVGSATLPSHRAASGGAAARSSAGSATGSDNKAATGEDFIDLGADKRVTMSKFSGRLQVDLREFYQKDGASLPGKKGISLKVAEWSTLVAALPQIDAAVQAKDMQYSLQLTPMRKVIIGEFKGRMNVSVREFYEKNGQLQHGAKGLSMTTEQWTRLSRGAEAFSANLPAA